MYFCTLKKPIIMLLGEVLSICTALSFTTGALFAETASKRIGSLPLNVTRMVMSIVLLAATLWVIMGTPYPRYADSATWLWLMLSGLIGYVLGDYCLFKGYIIIGSRFGQLLQTLSAPTAAITAWILLGESMRPIALIGMVVVLIGISMSILAKDDGEEKSSSTGWKLKFPIKGILFGCGAGIGQGVGLVISKIGLTHYNAAVEAQGLLTTSVAEGALLPIPMSISIPFAGTMIRAFIGLAGFSIALLLFSKNGKEQLSHAWHDRKSLWCALASTIFGPFVGVSLSLMATLYTSTGIAQTLMALSPIFIIAPSAIIFHQKVTALEVFGAFVSVAGACLFFR